MLLIDTYVKPSTILNAGDGLFTREFIAKGQPIWKRSDTDITISKYEAADIIYINGDWILKYGTQEENGDWYIDIDNMRYINHSNDKDNIRFYQTIGIAMRDININEELFTNYMDITSVWHYKKLLNTK